MSAIDSTLLIGPLLNPEQIQTLTEYLTDAHPSGDRLKLASLDGGVVVQNESGAHVISLDGSLRESA